MKAVVVRAVVGVSRTGGGPLLGAGEGGVEEASYLAYIGGISLADTPGS